MSEFIPKVTCACGCGERLPPQSGRGRRRLYIQGHRAIRATPLSSYVRSRPLPPKVPRPEPPPRSCTCGCGGAVESAGRGRPRQYLHGHRTDEQRSPSITATCACGCGETLVSDNPRRKYIEGHYTDAIKQRNWRDRNPESYASKRRRDKERKRPRDHGTLAWFARRLKSLGVRTVDEFRAEQERERASALRALNHAWSRCTSWTEFATCPPDVVVAADPEVDYTHFVYGLVDPRTKFVRYVGLTSEGVDRPREHRRPSKHTEHLYSARWVRELEACGLTFEIVVLEVLGEDWEALCAAEQWWIEYGRASGWPLTNLTDGGDGVKGLVKSDECRTRMSAITRDL